ncbi:MAG TPA: excinuclease ABC subunit UvrC, partial [Ruminococcaceae bacterium]|nr:excinuclease ABC subunit UvrC [Oscillospiraceae bacterium]
SNAAEQLAQQTGRTGREASALDELARLLGLAQPPEYIESYDISNLAGGDNVAGMVVFQNGRPLKSAYRKFKIKSFEGQDDYAAMREVIERRLEEYQKNRESGEGFGRLPDLILLDGGRGHVSAVRPILEERGLSIPLFGMVKDDRHRTRAIARDGGEIAINSSRSAFTLVSTIQDEVHRFAIGYHRQMRRKSTISS